MSELSATYAPVVRLPSLRKTVAIGKLAGGPEFFTNASTPPTAAISRNIVNTCRRMCARCEITQNATPATSPAPRATSR